MDSILNIISFPLRIPFVLPILSICLLFIVPALFILSIKDVYKDKALKDSNTATAAMSHPTRLGYILAGIFFFALLGLALIETNGDPFGVLLGMTLYGIPGVIISFAVGYAISYFSSRYKISRK